MPTYRLTKRFRFEMAHRLVKGYKGKCARLHGHSWNGELIVEVSGTDAQDMAVDFGAMGAIVKDWENRFDHMVALCHEDPLIPLLKSQGEPVLELMKNPTCEYIAAYLAADARCQMNLLVGDRLVNVAVRIEETCTTSCTVNG